MAIFLFRLYATGHQYFDWWPVIRIIPVILLNQSYLDQSEVTERRMGERCWNAFFAINITAGCHRSEAACWIKDGYSIFCLSVAMRALLPENAMPIFIIDVVTFIACKSTLYARSLICCKAAFARSSKTTN